MHGASTMLTRNDARLTRRADLAWTGCGLAARAALMNARRSSRALSR